MAHLFLQEDPKVSVAGSNDASITIPTPIELGSILFTYAATGPTGQTAAGYAALDVSGTPQWVPFGAAGPSGATGPSGPAGPPGGALDYSYIYGLVPQTPIAIGAPILFPFDGPNSGSAFITRLDASTLVLSPGDYRIGFQASFDSPAQVAVFVNNVVDPTTQAGVSTGTSMLTIDAIIRIPAGPALQIQIRNHLSAAAINPTVLAGGTEPQALQLTVLKLA